MNQPAIQPVSTFEIVPKGITLEIKDKNGTTFTDVYVGAGWDMIGDKNVDLDLVGACLVNGKLTAQTRLVYFGDRDEPGVLLSEDNTTGAGDGDDENMVIDLTKVESDITSIAIGIAAYAGEDLSSATNVHFRVCNGKDENSEQVFDVPMDSASAGDTVLHAANLIRSANGWTIENVSKFYQKGNGTAAIQGFAGLFA